MHKGIIRRVTGWARGRAIAAGMAGALATAGITGVVGIAAMAGILIANPASAQEAAASKGAADEPQFDIGMTLWTVYRYPLASFDASDEDRSSFDIDRLYISPEYTLDPRYSVKATLEASNDAGTLSFKMKRAYLVIDEPFSLKDHHAKIGQTDHVFVSHAEKAWGLRCVSKIPVDQYLGIGSTWTGVLFGGKTASGILSYDAQVANRLPYDKPAQEKYKSFHGRVTVTPAPSSPAWKGLKVMGFAMVNTDQAPAGDHMNLWYTVNPSYQRDGLAVSAELSARRDRTVVARESGDEVVTATARVLSAFAVVAPRAGTQVFARIDAFDPDTSLDEDERNLSTAQRVVWMAGVAHVLTKGVRAIVDLQGQSFDTPSGLESIDSSLTAAARVEVSI